MGTLLLIEIVINLKFYSLLYKKIPCFEYFYRIWMQGLSCRVLSNRMCHNWYRFHSQMKSFSLPSEFNFLEISKVRHIFIIYPVVIQVFFGVETQQLLHVQFICDWKLLLFSDLRNIFTLKFYLIKKSSAVGNGWKKKRKAPVIVVKSPESLTINK